MNIELEKLTDLELLELYKEEKKFTEYLEKLSEQVKKDIEADNNE